MEIEDEEAVKPKGWLDDEPEEIGDFDASKPEDWDEEEDGVWEPPKIDNPKYELAPGCGERKRPMLDGMLFDNSLIASDKEVADTYRETTSKPKFEGEREEKVEAAAGDGISIFYVNVQETSSVDASETSNNQESSGGREDEDEDAAVPPRRRATRRET